MHDRLPHVEALAERAVDEVRCLREHLGGTSEQLDENDGKGRIDLLEERMDAMEYGHAHLMRRAHDAVLELARDADDPKRRELYDLAIELEAAVRGLRQRSPEAE